MLYSTLLERADSLLGAGNKEAATADYQIAAQLMVDDTSEAQDKLAELAADAAP
jgi:hypothetical protein